MDEFAEQVVARVRAARIALEEAAGSASAGLGAALDELEDALRSAFDKGVEVPPAGRDEKRTGS
ncbi:hypothetical protein ACFO3J_22865 [Streptomyces polygonati]|uniref:Uncharacterized protein n=1 Tax=Streptomyces polygonati TaxID=1617087 RepID=A0ABV8HRG1_9ACTN